jgi:hypothetical protein
MGMCRMTTGAFSGIKSSSILAMEKATLQENILRCPACVSWFTEGSILRCPACVSWFAEGSILRCPACISWFAEGTLLRYPACISWLTEGSILRCPACVSWFAEGSPELKSTTREAHLLLVLTLSQESSGLGKPKAACMYVHSKHAEQTAQECDDAHNHEELLWQTLHVCCPAANSAAKGIERLPRQEN